LLQPATIAPSVRASASVLIMTRTFLPGGNFEGPLR
jgi:hypothetical protein